MPSFGFGGVNTHVILEAHSVAHQGLETEGQIAPLYTPFVFSAASESSLTKSLSEFRDWLQKCEKGQSLHDLAHTLRSRRTRFRYSTAIAASNLPDLCTGIECLLAQSQVPINGELSSKAVFSTLDHQTPSVLGVFTGQGAQWARQGWDHVASSKKARSIIHGLEIHLSQLPESDRPSWSLLEELERDESTSRIHSAALSQPLCTAIQILQVDLLRAAKVRLSAIVGHSSGEIAAAYAAGRISARDAICIAYYRGRYSHLSRSGEGKAGSMIAVGTSFEDAQSICELPEFRGRACVAAINSPMSVTLSGDHDAMEELNDIFTDEQKPCRTLKIDKAYHSHHMMPCKEPYLEALRRLSIKVFPAGECAWFSSVTNCGLANAQQDLEGEYWVRNLTQSVLFMQALQSALFSQIKFGLALEIGPHITLKGPALETIEDSIHSSLPYTSMLIRGKDSIISVANALGYVWAHLGNDSVDFQSIESFLSGNYVSHKLIKGLPKYSWDHDREYWHESRLAHVERSRPAPANLLLGTETATSTKHEMQWRQILVPGEIPWLKGHKLQEQIVFPAAAYIVLAAEAALAICKGHLVSLIEVLDVKMGKALTFDHEETKVEGIFSLSQISREHESIVTASFTYCAADDRVDASLDIRATGHLRIALGAVSNCALPARNSPVGKLWKVSPEDFYNSLRMKGYQYTPPFTNLSDLKREFGKSTGTISCGELLGELIIHPAIIDAAFQSIFLARAAPFDGGIWTLHVPRCIRSVRINPALCQSNVTPESSLQFDASINGDRDVFDGTVDVYTPDLDHAMLQIDGLEVCDLQLLDNLMRF